MQNVILYYRPTCGYCVRVLRFIQENQIKVNLRNVSESTAIRQELIGVTGMSQVPCLIHNGQILYESADIIQWLAENGEKDDHA